MATYSEVNRILGAQMEALGKAVMADVANEIDLGSFIKRDEADEKIEELRGKMIEATASHQDANNSALGTFLGRSDRLQQSFRFYSRQNRRTWNEITESSKLNPSNSLFRQN